MGSSFALYYFDASCTLLSVARAHQNGWSSCTCFYYIQYILSSVPWSIIAPVLHHHAHSLLLLLSLMKVLHLPQSNITITSHINNKYSRTAFKAVVLKSTPFVSINTPTHSPSNNPTHTSSNDLPSYTHRFQSKCSYNTLCIYSYPRTFTLQQRPLQACPPCSPPDIRGRWPLRPTPERRGGECLPPSRAGFLRGGMGAWKYRVG